MDWVAFFERTRKAAEVESLAKLAPLIGVSDGAISHYRVGRNLPQVWVVADCLRIQGHPNPEKAAVEIMRMVAKTSTERTFWKRLSNAAAVVIVLTATLLPGVGIGEASASGERPSASCNRLGMPIMSASRVGKWLRRLVLRLTTQRKRRHAYLLALQG